MYHKQPCAAMADELTRDFFQEEYPRPTGLKQRGNVRFTR